MEYDTLLPPEKYITEFEQLYESIEAHDYTDRYSKTTDMTIAICSRLKYFYIFHYRELSLDETDQLFNLLAVYYKRLPLYGNVTEDMTEESARNTKATGYPKDDDRYGYCFKDDPDEYIYNQHDIACQRRTSFSLVGFGYIDWRFQMDIRGLYPIRTKQYVALKREIAKKLRDRNSQLTHEVFANDIRRRMETAKRLGKEPEHPLNRFYDMRSNEYACTIDQLESIDESERHDYYIIEPGEIDNHAKWFGAPNIPLTEAMIRGDYREQEGYNLYDIIANDNVDAFAEYIERKWVPIWSEWKNPARDKHWKIERWDADELEAIGDRINETRAIGITKWAIANGHKILYSHIHPNGGVCLYPEIYELVADLPVCDLWTGEFLEERDLQGFHSTTIMRTIFERSVDEDRERVGGFHSPGKPNPIKSVEWLKHTLIWVRSGVLSALDTVDYKELNKDLLSITNGDYKRLHWYTRTKFFNGDYQLVGFKFDPLIADPSTIIRLPYTQQLCFMSASIALYVRHKLVINGVLDGVSLYKAYERYRLHRKHKRDRRKHNHFLYYDCGYHRDYNRYKEVKEPSDYYSSDDS